MDILKRILPGPFVVRETYDEREATYLLTQTRTTSGDKDKNGKNGISHQHFEISRKSLGRQFLDVYNARNVALIVSYFSVGVASRLIATPVDYYLIYDLDASSTDYSSYKTLHRLPWSIKFVFGMLSDGLPMLGYRRKPWLFFGWAGFALINLWLERLFNPSINETIFLVFAMTCFLVLADVCTDTLCVERSAFETEAEKGKLQSTGFVFRSIGRVLGAILGAFLYENGTDWSFNIAQIFLLDALIPIFCMALCTYSLIEIASLASVPLFIDQLVEVWRIIQLKAVWFPYIFIYSYSMLQVPNSAWNNFLVYGLNFDDEMLGYLTITAAIVSCFGYITFKFALFEASWRRIYIGTTLINFLFSLLQVFLILRLNVPLGIPDIVFAVGDEAMVALMDGLHAMPTVIMFVMLCPAGAEGTTFALLTTISSLAGTVASDIGTYLTSIWDVSNDTISAGDYSGVLKLTILTSFIQLLPIFLVWILPDGKEEHKIMIAKNETSFYGGLTLALVVSISLIYTVVYNVILLLL